MHPPDMNTVDLVVIAILAVSGILALMRGLVRELVVLIVWAGSVVITARAYPLAKPWMAQHIKSEMGADAATALSVFCLSLVILIPLGSLISGMVRGRTLTAIDRSLGLIFGVLRGVLLVSIVYLGMSWVWPEKDMQPEWLQKAKTKPFMEVGAEVIKSIVPKDKLEKTKEDIKEGKNTAEKTLDSVDQLNKLSTPVPGNAEPNKDKDKEQKSPAYGDESRSGLDRLINEKGK